MPIFAYTKVLKISNHLFFLKIIPVDNDWCRGTINGVEGFVPKAYISEKPNS